MNAAPFKRDGEWLVLLTWDGGEEEAGPFDDELDAVEMARRSVQP